MPPATRFEAANRQSDAYFGARSQQDAKLSRGLLACFGFGKALSGHVDEGPHSHHASADTRRHSTGGGKVAPGGLAVSSGSCPHSESVEATGPNRRLSYGTVQVPLEGPGAGGKTLFGIKLTKLTNAAAAAGPGNDAASSDAGSPLAATAIATSGPSSTSAFTEVFHPFRHPRKPLAIRGSAGAIAARATAVGTAVDVTAIDDTADEVATPNAAAVASTSTSASVSGSPKARSLKAASSSSAYDDATSHGSAPSSPYWRQQQKRQQEEQDEKWQQQRQQQQQQENRCTPGMVIAVGSFNEADAVAAGAYDGLRASAPASDTTVIAAGAAGLVPMDGLKLRPAFLRRGASCSGAEEPPGLSALVAGSPNSAAAGLRASVARRSSYAGDSGSPNLSVASPGLGLLGSPEQPMPSPLRPTPPSLRATPPQPQLLQPCGMLMRPSPNSPQAAPRPNLLQPCGSLMRPGGISVGSVGLSGCVKQQLLPQSPSLMRSNQLQIQSTGLTDGGATDDGPLRLPVVELAPAGGRPMLKHSPQSFSRNVTTTTAVAALTLKPTGSMAYRGGALPPMSAATIPPSPAEAAAAFNRLASLQMLHRHRVEREPPPPEADKAQQQPEKDGEEREHGGTEAQQPVEFAIAGVEKGPSRAVTDAAGHPEGEEQDDGTPAMVSRASRTESVPGVGNLEAPGHDGAGAGHVDEYESDSVVGDMRPLPVQLRSSAPAIVCGSPGGFMRRGSSQEQPCPTLPLGALGAARVRVNAISDAGEAGAGTGPEAAMSSPHTLNWLDSLQPPAQSPAGGFVRCEPEPIEPLPEPEISHGSLGSTATVAAAAPPVPPLLVPFAGLSKLAPTLRDIGSASSAAPIPGGMDSFKCLLQEIDE